MYLWQNNENFCFLSSQCNGFQDVQNMLIFGQNLPNYYETKPDKLGFEDFLQIAIMPAVSPRDVKLLHKNSAQHL